MEMAALAEEEASGPSDEMLVVASHYAGWSSSDWKCPSATLLSSAFAWAFRMEQSVCEQSVSELIGTSLLGRLTLGPLQSHIPV